MSKLFINSRGDYVELNTDRGSMLTEIATRQRRQDFWSITQFLPNPDPVLKKQGKDITAYHELLSDAHLGGCVDTRKGQVLGLEWDVDRGKAKSRQAKVIRQAFDRMDVERIIGEILDAPLFGYQPFETLWEERDGYIVPRDIVAKPQEWFVFNIEGEPLFRSKDSWNGEPVNPAQIFVVRHDARYDNPYGRPVLARCFWPAVFKKGGVKFWVTFTERYGMPIVSGKYPDGWIGNQGRIDEFFDAIESMVQDAMFVLPQSADLNVTQTGGSASAEIFSGLTAWANSEISKAIFGHGAAADSTSGKLGNESGAEESAASKLQADKKLVASAMNHVIRIATRLNFGDGAVAPEFILYEEEDVDQSLAERDAKLYTIGWRPTPAYIQREYGLDEADFTLVDAPAEPTAPAPGQPPANPFGAPPAFAEPGCGCGHDHAEGDQVDKEQATLDAAVNKTGPQKLQFQMKKALAPVLKLIDEATDFDEVLSQLVELYPSMSTKDLEETLGRALFMAETMGRLGIQREEAEDEG